MDRIVSCFRKIFAFVIAGIFLLFATACGTEPNAVPRQTTAPPARTDGILVKFRVTATPGTMTRAMNTSGVALASQFQIVPGLAQVRIAADTTVDQALATIRANPAVEYAEPNYIRTINAAPNDPQFAQLWGLQNTGQSSGTKGADIRAVDAWNTETGADVVIAVIDSGVDYTHEDLKDNIWINSGEIPNNGVDDDSNGFVDDVRGWDFANNDNNPMDDVFHGTHVAGTIAASGNNGIGVAGVNWHARIMPLKFIGANGGGSDSDAIKAIEYAVKMGARVSNNSWGGSGNSQALGEAIANAERQGHLFVAAAGNDGSNNDVRAIYPASYDLPNIIAVAATDRNDKLATFSNFGIKSVDLGAPGVDILSTVPTNGYRSLQGTSMASPHVTGSAALLFAYQSTLTYAEVKNALLNNVDPAAALASKTVSGGRLNVAKALASLGGRVKISATHDNVPLKATLQFTASEGSAPYMWSVSDPSVASINEAGLLTALAVGKTRVQVVDAAGNKGSSGDIAITRTQITPNAGLVAVGKSVTFTASGGTAPYLWSSSNAAIASVDASGKLTGVRAGSVSVTATDANGVSASSGSVQVIEPVLAVNPSTGILGVGSTLQFSVTGGTAPYSWFSADTTLGAIDVNGLFSAVGPGITYVGVHDAQSVYGLSNAIEIRNITINPQTAQLSSGQKMPFTVAGGRPPYTWSVSDSDVASIAVDGMLTGLAGGMVTVTATDADGAVGRSGSIVVVGSSQLTLSPTSATLQIGDSLQFKVLGGFPPYQWASSNPAAASINASGLLTAKAVGLTFITATDSRSNRATSSLIQVRKINITPNTSSVAIGQSVQFYATGGTPPYQWTVSDTTKASISTSGLFTGLVAGTVTVSAVDNTGLRGTSGAITIGNAAAPPTLQISPSAAQLSVGQSVQFNTVGGTSPYVWKSSAAGVATVDAGGKVTAVSAGAATISVTDATGATANASVTVAGNAGGGGSGGGLTVSPAGVQIVKVGATLTFNVAGGSPPYLWLPSNSLIGTVDQNGVFKGVTAGVTNVNVRDAAGNMASSSNIIVSQ